MARGQITSRINWVFTGGSFSGLVYLRHAALHGHCGQRGLVGAKKVAPSSIRPWLKYTALADGTRRAAISRISFSLVSPKTRPRTLRALPSTAGKRLPNAMLRTAPAV